MSCLGDSCGTVPPTSGKITTNLSREVRHLEPVRFTPHRNNINNTNGEYNSVESGQCALVKEEEIFTHLMGLIKSMKETNFLVPGETGYHTKYRWSFYEPFGIPQYSKTDYCLIYNYRTLFKRFNYRGPWRTWARGNPSNNLLDWLFDTEPDTCVFNIFRYADYSKYKHTAQPYNLFLLINYKQPNTIQDDTNYKIHFMVDESFALYVLIKAMMIMYNRDKKRGIVRHLVGKILLSFRLSKFGQTGKTVLPGHRNTFVPTVVIYTGTDSADETREILEELLKAFPEHDQIGLMELGSSNKIAYGNIRLNKLLCYAQGDRANKLEIKEKNSNEIFPEGYSKYIMRMTGETMYYSPGKEPTKERPENFPKGELNISEKLIPDWVNTMISKCASSEGDINKRSQTFFGVNFCDPKYSNLSSKCNVEPICYFSVDKTCLDPNTIEGVQGIDKTSEFSTALTVRSLNGSGGMRKTRKRKGRRVRKTRR